MFFLNEPIRLHIPSERDDGAREQVILRNQAGAVLETEAVVAGGRAIVEIPAGALAAGPLFDESYGAWTAAAAGKTFEFTVVNGLPNSSFTIAMYGGGIPGDEENTHGGKGPLPVEERQKLYRDTYGLNLIMNTGALGGPIPVEQANRIARLGARIVAQHVVAGQHQPGGTSTSWAEPGVQLACRYRASWVAQAWKRISGAPFAGVHYADEPGLTWGGQNAEGKMRHIFQGEQDHYTGPFAVPAQHEAYRRETGREPADWRHPEKDWQGWREFQRFRVTILGDLFADITDQVHRIDKDLLGYSQVYAWRTTAEGIYPPETAKGVDVLSTHGYAMWTYLGHMNPAFEVDAMRSGAWDKPLWMLGPWKGHQAAEGGVRAVMYGLLARKVEGIVWPLDWMRDWPEAEEVSQKILPISGMLHDTEKPRDAVGLFHSLDQHLKINSENLYAPNPGQSYHGRMLTAWWNINAAGFPASWLTEEDILTGVLEQHDAVVAPTLTWVRPEIKNALEQYIEKGGTVILDAASTVTIKGAVKLGAEFKDGLDPEILEPITPVNSANMQIAFDTLVAPNLAELRPILHEKATPPAVVDSPHAQLGEYLAGKGRYLWVVNQQNRRVQDTQFDPVPMKTRLQLPDDAAVVYDVFAQEKLQRRELDLHLAAGDAKLYALLPDTIEEVSVSNITWQAGEFVLEATVSGAEEPIPAILPVAVRVFAPDGARLLQLYRATDENGRIALRIPIGAAMPGGEYRIEMEETVTGRTVRETVTIGAEKLQVTDAGAVEIFDRDKVANFADRTGEVLVLYGDAAHKPLAEKLAANLNCPERPVRAAAAEKFEKPIDIVISGQIFNFFSGIMVKPLAVHKDVIVLGNRQNNTVMKQLVEPFLLGPWPQFHTSKIGSGRGVIWWAADACGIGYDIISVYAEDDTGLDRAVKTLQELF